MDGTSSTAEWEEHIALLDARIADLEADNARLSEDNAALKRARKICNAQLREQKADYVRTLNHMTDLLQREMARSRGQIQEN